MSFKILKGAGATFLARHVSMDGMRAVESVKKGIHSRGFSLIHMPYPCPTNFASRELGIQNTRSTSTVDQIPCGSPGKEKTGISAPPAYGMMQATRDLSFPSWCVTP